MRNDLRVLRTRKNIRQAFIEMFCEMDYEAITIKELAERAMINRKTFYAHYDSLDELLEEIRHDTAQKFIERTKDMKRPRDIDKVTREFFMYSEELGMLGEKLNCHETPLSLRIKDEILNTMWEKDNDKCRQNIIMTFITQSTLNIYRQWVLDGRKIPLDQIIKLASDLICNGVRGMEKKEK